MKTLWTKAEEIKLMKWFSDRESISTIAERLDKSFNACQYKVQQLRGWEKTSSGQWRRPKKRKGE